MWTRLRSQYKGRWPISLVQVLKPLISPSDLLDLSPFSFTLSSSSCVKPSKAPRTRTTSARFFSGVLKYDISMFFTKDLQVKANARLENDCLSKKNGNWLLLSQTMLSIILPGLFETEKLEILLCTVRKENTSTTMAGKMLQQNQEHGLRRVLVEASRR